MFALMCLLSLQTALAYGAERCQNYPTNVRLHKFREGDWIDQLRIFPGHGDYVSQFHPNETVSMFLAKFNTNCGLWDLKALADDELELSKGYYSRRFQEHFYPFQVKFKQNSSELRSEFYLEQLHCKQYEDLTSVIGEVNILRTDYSSFAIIHQCVDNRNYLMFLMKEKKLFLKDKHEMEQLVIDVMRDFGIVMENRTFWWATDANCDKHVENIFPTFYRKIYIDRNQSECSEQLVVKLIDLKDFWQIKMDLEAEAWEELKTILTSVAIMLCGTAAILGVFAIFLDNFEP